MSFTLLTGSFSDRHRCPDCNEFVGVSQTSFGDPCPRCGFRESDDRYWKWELSRWRLVLGWPMLVWDHKDDAKKDSWDEW